MIGALGVFFMVVVSWQHIVSDQVVIERYRTLHLRSTIDHSGTSMALHLQGVWCKFCKMPELLLSGLLTSGLLDHSLCSVEKS